MSLKMKSQTGIKKLRSPTKTIFSVTVGNAIASGWIQRGLKTVSAGVLTSNVFPAGNFPMVNQGYQFSVRLQDIFAL